MPKYKKTQVAPKQELKISQILIVKQNLVTV